MCSLKPRPASSRDRTMARDRWISRQQSDTMTQSSPQRLEIHFKPSDQRNATISEVCFLADESKITQRSKLHKEGTLKHLISPAHHPKSHTPALTPDSHTSLSLIKMLSLKLSLLPLLLIGMAMVTATAASAVSACFRDLTFFRWLRRPALA